MTSKALITGISGQDGAYLAEHLLKNNYEVYGMERRSTARVVQIPSPVTSSAFSATVISPNNSAMRPSYPVTKIKPPRSRTMKAHYRTTSNGAKLSGKP